MDDGYVATAKKRCTFIRNLAK